MKKIDQKKLIISCLIILLPILVGLLLWNKLPDQIATHFDNANQANGWSSKPLTVFGLPLFLLGTHLLVVFFTGNDPRRQNITKPFVNLIYWIVPVTTVIVFAMTYGIALKLPINISTILSVFMGILFIVIGNYLPKCKSSYTVGIRLPWTLSDEENWNRTHKFASWLWILAGILFLISCLLQLPSMLTMIVIMGLAVVLPCIYSFLLYKKKAH